MHGGHGRCSLQYVYVWLSIIHLQLIERLYSCHQAAACIFHNNPRHSTQRRTQDCSRRCSLHGAECLWELCELQLAAWSSLCFYFNLRLLLCLDFVLLHLLYSSFVCMWSVEVGEASLWQNFDLWKKGNWRGALGQSTAITDKHFWRIAVGITYTRPIVQAVTFSLVQNQPT